MNRYKEKLDAMTWSFSRVHSYETCPYQFYLQQIEKNQYGISNFYAELGHFMHEVLENILLGNLELKDAANYFVEHIDENIFNYVKQSTMDKSIDACIEYLASTDFELLEGFEIVGVELKCEYDFEESIPYIGYIDLLLKHKEDGHYVIVDHKSSGYPLKKNGDVLKSEIESFTAYKRQIYLYSRYVYEKYGVYPEELWWNHFKANKVVKIQFDKEEYEESQEWFRNTIAEIYKDQDFLPNMSYMQCNVLCDFREECEYQLYGDD